MKYLISIGICIALISCTPTDSMKETTESKLFVAYKSPSMNILVSGNQIEWIKTESEYDNPVSGTPSSQKKVKSKPKTLPKTSIEELTKLLETSGFYELKATYGATEIQRHYPYYITVRKGNVVKAVTFRSNPSAEKRPAAFKEVEDYLLKLK